MSENYSPLILDFTIDGKRSLLYQLLMDKPELQEFCTPNESWKDDDTDSQPPAWISMDWIAAHKMSAAGLKVYRGCHNPIPEGLAPIA